MNNPFKNGCSIQIGDLVIGFFANQRQLLSTAFFGHNNSGFPDCSVLHTHFYAEVFACGKGEVTIRTVRGDFKLSSGQIAIIPSGVLHCKLECNDKSDVQWITAGVVCSSCKSSGEAQLYSKICDIFLNDSTSVFKTNDDFYSIMVKAVGNSVRSATLSDVVRFASELCCVLAESKKLNEEGSGNRRAAKQDLDRLLKLDVLLNARYMYNISNRYLADELFLSERQLSRFVNRYYGIPLHTLINNKRIEAAAAMLTDTNRSVEQIASDVGFSSKSGFYREFVKLYGKTPLQFRKNASDTVRE